jgi:cation diffusion facilitator family transporter
MFHWCVFYTKNHQNRLIKGKELILRSLKMGNEQITDKERSHQAKKVTLIGFFVNTILTIIKITAGILGKSNAMLADGIHSLSDFFTDIVVLVGFKFTDKPADKDHNFGHEKYETFATFIIGIALLLAGFNILQNGMSNVYKVVVKNEILPKPEIIALFAACISIVFKELLYRYTKKVGHNINSPAVIANGWHHRSDALSSVGTLIGISIAYFLGDKWIIFDPIAAIVVSVFIFKVAFEVMLPAINELLESSLDEKDVKYITNLLDSTIGVEKYHNLRTRKLGPNIAIEAHLMFEKTISLYDAHAISEAIEKQLNNYYGKRSIITFHLEPNYKKYIE